MKSLEDEVKSAEIPFHIMDLNDIYYSWSQRHWIDEHSYIANEYFYKLFIEETDAEYYSLRYGNTLTSLFKEVFGKLRPYFSHINTHIEVDSGFTYSLRDLNQGDVRYLHEPVRIIGKFFGSDDFNLFVTARMPGGAIFQEQLQLSTAPVHALDSIAHTIWTAGYLNEINSSDPSDDEIRWIIEESMDNRILTPYTAFLALEPGMKIEDFLDPGTDPNDLDGNPWTSGIDDEQLSEDVQLNLIIYPNPFQDQTSIQFELEKAGHVKIEIYDVAGKLITTIIDETYSGGQHTVQFDTGSLPNGVYLCTLKVDDVSLAHQKMVILK